MKIEKFFKCFVLSTITLLSIMIIAFYLIFHFTGYHFHIPIGSTIFIEENKVDTTYSCAICLKPLDNHGRDIDGKNFSSR